MTTPALLATVFMASLAGSLHCAGMCGGFVAFYSGGARGRGMAHLAYSLGRLATYVMLGALFGALGAAVDQAGSWAGVQRTAAILAGVLMVVWGGYALLQALDVRLPRFPVPAGVARFTSKAMGSLRDKPPVLRAGLLGLLSTLLPCGWLYAFATLAGGTGSPWLGALVMAAFWAGTVPILLGFGLVLQRLSAPLRQRLPVVTASLLIVIGLLWLAGRVTGTGHAGHSGHSPLPGVETPAEHDHGSSRARPENGDGRS